MKQSISITTHGPEQTHAIGRRLGEHLGSGDVVALIGDLAAGKTVLTQGLAEGLGVPSDVAVASPTFTLINRHQGRCTLIHIDLYRISHVSELDSLGYEEWLDPLDAVSVIEWADRAEELLPHSYLRIEMCHAGGDDRTMTIRPINPVSDRIPLILADLSL